MNLTQWDRFAGHLLSYIEEANNKFIKTDYSIKLNMSLGEVQKELIEKSSIDELSPELRKIAEEYLEKHPMK